MTAREAAFLSLQKYRGSGKYANIELSGAIDRYRLEGAEKTFYTALFYGVIEREITLDYLISQISDRKVEEIDRDIRTILHIGLYQLEYMDKVPESAAVNESVKLATRFYARKNSESFINAVLRNFLRDREKITFPKKERDFIRWLCVTYSMPEWICRLFTEAYGKKRAEEIAAASLSHPTMTLRANTLRTTQKDLTEALRSEGISCEKSRAPHGIHLNNHVPLDKLEPFRGLFFVQDEASQIAVAALGAKPGETVLDCCACPGGKSFGLAMDMENTGTVYSRDLHKNKLSLIDRTAAELGITVLKTAEQNATVFDETMPEVDRLLCDVPCSGLGVLAKKPDIKYKNPEDIEKLPQVQSAILETAARYLRVGGTAVYATCTLNPKENRDVITAFLANHPEFSLVPFSAGGYFSDGLLELFPGETSDGFFICKMTKNAK